MSRIPAKCPKCGRSKAWKEAVNPVTSGVPTAFGRVRVGVAFRGSSPNPSNGPWGAIKSLTAATAAASGRNTICRKNARGGKI